MVIGVLRSNMQYQLSSDPAAFVKSTPGDHVPVPDYSASPIYDGPELGHILRGGPRGRLDADPQKDWGAHDHATDRERVEHAKNAHLQSFVVDRAVPLRFIPVPHSFGVEKTRLKRAQDRPHNWSAANRFFGFRQKRPQSCLIKMSSWNTASVDDMTQSEWSSRRRPSGAGRPAHTLSASHTHTHTQQYRSTTTHNQHAPTFRPSHTHTKPTFSLSPYLSIYYC